MRYLLLIGGDVTTGLPGGATAADICAGPAATAWREDLERRGVYLGGELLRPHHDATTVRVRDDEVLVSDGPFTETKEQIGGVSVVECADLDEAIAVAAAHPAARMGIIEVRPVWAK